MVNLCACGVWLAFEKLCVTKGLTEGLEVYNSNCTGHNLTPNKKGKHRCRRAFFPSIYFNDCP